MKKKINIKQLLAILNNYEIVADSKESEVIPTKVHSEEDFDNLISILMPIENLHIERYYELFGGVSAMIRYTGSNFNKLGADKNE